MLPIIISALLLAALVSAALLVPTSANPGPRLCAPSPLLVAALGMAACDASTGCATLQKSGPSLESVIARVDVPRLLSCAGRPTKEVAKCLGAEALTQGLQIAISEATKLAERAVESGHPGAGADDMTASQRDALAADLDATLYTLATEIAKANAEHAGVSL